MSPIDETYLEELNLTIGQATLLKFHGFTIKYSYLTYPCELYLNEYEVGFFDHHQNMWNIYLHSMSPLPYEEIVKKLNILLGENSAG